jgi:hypothetical protein
MDARDSLDRTIVLIPALFDSKRTLDLNSHRSPLELPQAPAPRHPRDPAHTAGVHREHSKRDSIARLECTHSQVHRSRCDVRLYGVQHSLTLHLRRKKTYKKKTASPFQLSASRSGGAPVPMLLGGPA